MTIENQLSRSQSDLPGTLWNFVWRYMRVQKLHIAGMLFVGLAWCTEMIVKPLLVKKIIDTSVSATGNTPDMIYLIGWFCFIYIVISALGVLVDIFYKYINARLYPKLSAQVITDMHEYLINHSYSFFQSNFSGVLIKKIFDMSSNIEKLIRMPGDQFFVVLLRLIFTSVFLFYVVHPIFSIVVIAWSILFVCTTYFLAKKSEKYAREMSEADAGVGGVLSDSITNIVSIKLFSGTTNELKKVSSKLKSFVLSSRALQVYSMKTNMAQGLGVVVLIGLMLGLLVYYKSQNVITAGDFALVIMLGVAPE